MISAMESRNPCPSEVRAPATMRPLLGLMMSPTALTATRAATTRPVSPILAEAVPNPDFIANCGPKSLPTVAPAPAPTLLRHRPRGSGGARLISGFGSRAYFRIADAQVKQDCRRNDRHHAGWADFESQAVFFEITHDACGGIETKSTASGKHDGLHLFDGIDGTEQIGLASAGSRAAHIHARDRARFTQDDSASRGALLQSSVTDLDAGNVGQAAGAEPFDIGGAGFDA